MGISSYSKLKSKYDNLVKRSNKLWVLYVRKRRQLEEIGVGADMDDYLIGDEGNCKINSIGNT